MTVIPLDWCLGGSDLTEPRLSPDGSRVVHVRSTGGEAVLVVTDLDSGTRQVIAPTPGGLPGPRPARQLGGGCFDWIDGRTLVVAARDGGLWEVAVEPIGAGRPLVAGSSERVAGAPSAGGGGRWVTYTVDDAVAEASEVWALDRETGARWRVDDGRDAFVLDPVVLDGEHADGPAIAWVAWSPPAMPWDHSVVRCRRAHGAIDTLLDPPGAVQQPRPIDGAVVWVRDDSGWLNVWCGDAPLAAEAHEHAGPSWGPGQRSFAAAPGTSAGAGTVAFTRNEAGFGRLCTVDMASGRVDERARGVHGQLSWRGDRLVALRTGARTPTSVVVYDTSDWSRREIDIGPDPRWDRDLLVEPETHEVHSADGAIVHARLYRADEPTDRLLCWVHGGPTDQWQVTFQARIAYWRSRGWNVVVPDHRGSTGFGRAYQQALRGRWGELDVADVRAVVEAMQQRGIGHPTRTALLGGSAGGFTVLGVLAATTDQPISAAAVVSYPVSDLADLRVRSHRFERHYTDTLVGDGGDPRTAVLERDRSPLTFAHRIRVPVLVLHGADDPVVPLDQSERLVERITAAGGVAELRVYPGEGHGIRSPEHQLDEYRRVEEFLARTIG